MSSQGRRRSVIEAAYERAAKAEDEFISKLDEREKKPLDETLASLPASQVPAESGSLEAVIRHIVANGLVPFTFGVALQKGRVFEPKVIQDMFLLRDFTMMSMFLGAVSTSQLLFALLSAIPEDASSHTARYLGQHFRRVKDSYQKARGSQRGTTASAVGAAMLGTGMALAGACPGTVFAAAGSGVAGTEYVLAGGIAGVSIFTALERTLLPKLFDRSKIAEPRLEKNLSQGNDAAKPWYGSFSKLALVSSLALGAAAVAFNKYFPNSSRYASPGEIRTLMDALKAPYWNPILSGMVVGSLQVPMVLFADTFLGTTSQFLSLIAPLQPIFRALGLADSKSEISKWSPIASAKTIVGGWGFVGMMAAGAYFSSTLSGTRNIVPGLLAEGVTAAPSLILDKAHPLIQPLVAGALLWFGSRTALGCTSGHGISGFSLLSVNSLVAVASMFGSGIAAAQILKNYV